MPIKPIETETVDEREIIFEPSPEDILETLLKKYVQNQVYVSWLDNDCSRLFVIVFSDI